MHGVCYSAAAYRRCRTGKTSYASHALCLSCQQHPPCPVSRLLQSLTNLCCYIVCQSSCNGLCRKRRIVGYQGESKRCMHPAPVCAGLCSMHPCSLPAHRTSQVCGNKGIDCEDEVHVCNDGMPTARRPSPKSAASRMPFATAPDRLHECYAAGRPAGSKTRCTLHPQQLQQAFNRQAPRRIPLAGRPHDTYPTRRS